MTDPVLYTAVLEAARLAFVVCVPLVLILGCVGILVGALQGMTAIPEPAMSYAAKFFALLAVFYLFLPGVWDALTQLCEQLYR